MGLRRGSVLVVGYDARWPRLFLEEKERLLTVFYPEFTEIEHIGSTSVPRLSAKPLIDIMVAVPSLQGYEQYIQSLIKLGYEYMPERVFSDRIFLPKGSRDNRTHHLSLVEKGSHQWNETLRFRDMLRAGSDLAERYGRLKLELAAKYPEDRYAYTEAKEKFIKEVLA